MDIEITISKSGNVRTTIIEPVKDMTMTALLASLKSVKQQSNDTMTNLVNSEKTSCGSINSQSKRKDQDDGSESQSEIESDEDHSNSIKKLRSDDEPV